MPNIRQVDSQVSSLNPSERGATARAIAGGRVQSAYESVGNDVGRAVSGLGKQYVDYRTSAETLDALALAAKAQEVATAGWNQAMADDAAAPTHDPQLGEKWREQSLKPALDAIGQTFTTKEGQEWWQQQRLKYDAHYQETTAADMSTLAGMQAVRSYEATGNSAQSLAYNDPSAGQLAQDSMKEAAAVAIRALGPSATPQAIAAIQQQAAVQAKAIAVAQARGMIDQAADPIAASQAFLASKAAVTMLDDGQRASITSYAEQVKRSNDTSVKAAAAEDKRVQNELADKASATLSASMVGEDGSIVITPDTIKAMKAYSEMPGADPGQVRALANMIASHVDDDAGATQKHDKDDPLTYSNFVSRALLPESDPSRLTRSEIFQANANFLISDRTMNRLQEQLKADADPARKTLDQSLERYFQAVKPSFKATNEFGEPDPVGDAKFYRFQYDMRQLMDLQIRSGMKPQDVEKSLLDPTSRAFIGRQADVYRRTGQSGAEVRAAAAASGQEAPMLRRPGTAPTAAPQPGRTPKPGVVPWKPGETAAEYLARTK